MENYLFNFCKNVNFEECIDTLKKKLKRSNQIEEYDFICLEISLMKRLDTVERD